MKPLQNPYVVGALTLVALVFIFRNALGPLWHRFRPANQPPPSATAAPGSSLAPVVPPLVVPPAATSKRKPKVPAGAGIDVKQVQVDAPSWVESPRRDPFQTIPAPEDLAATKTSQKPLALQAIWRQTGSQLAVINGRVVGEGDPIERFTIEKIESDVVWLRGPGGRKSLNFNTTAAPQSTPP